MPTLSSPQLAEVWWEQQKSLEGFREGIAMGPKGQQLALEVSSWMQVPRILQLLQSDADLQIRIVFPDQGDSGIWAEQSEIREFLRDHHTTPINDIAGALGQKIEGCGLFSSLPSLGISTGAEWVAAHNIGGRGRDLQLGVTDIATLEEVRQDTIDHCRGVIASALTEHRDSGIPLVIIVPEDQAALRTSATLAQEMLASKPDLSPAWETAQVWIGGGESVFTSTHQSTRLQKPTAASFKQFVESYHTPLANAVHVSSQTTAPPPDTSNSSNSATSTSGALLSAHQAIRAAVQAPDHSSIEDFLKDRVKASSDWLALHGEDVLRERSRAAPDYEMGLIPTFAPILQENCAKLGSSKTNMPGVGDAPSTKHNASAHELLERCKSRTLAEACRVARQDLDAIDTCRHQSELPGTSQQVGNVVLLPDKGTTYFLTDLEGSVDTLVKLLEEERILERWRKNDPNDQVFLCILGDFVDRSTTGGLLFELLLELKFREGFERQVIIVPGNHELFLDQHLRSSRVLPYSRGTPRYASNVGFAEEMLAWRHLEADELCLKDPSVKEMISYCPDSLNPDAYGFDQTQAALFRARAGLWMTFCAAFRSLPKTILGENGLYAAHAGFPVSERFGGLTGTSQVAVGPDGPEGLIQLLANEIDEITWNDFCETADQSSTLRTDNTRRNAGFYFGDKAFKRFAAITGSSLFVRGHQKHAPSGATMVQANGVNRAWSWKTEHIFTLVDSDEGWFSSLDLSIKDPSPNDVQLNKLGTTA